MITEFLPLRLGAQNDKIVVDWVPLNTLDLPEPFFFQTVERLGASGEQSLVTDVDEFAAFEQMSHDVHVAFVFHVSHCGSTLFSNVLKTVSDALVISEPPLMTVGQLLSPVVPNRFPPDMHQRLLRATVNAYALNGPKKRYLFFKFMDLASLSLPLLRRLFPHVPFLFIYRDPRHVIASQVREVPEDVFNSIAPEIRALLGKGRDWSPPRARFFGAIFEGECLRAAITPGVTAVNYRDLTPERSLEVLQRLGVHPDDIDADAVRAQFGTYSKAIPGTAKSFDRQSESERRKRMIAQLDPNDYAGAMAIYDRIDNLVAQSA